MPDTELAEELLQIEEADAWFEYLEATRGQTETRYARGRAVGLGPPDPAAARGPRPPGAAPPGRRLSRRRRGAGVRPGRCYACRARHHGHAISTSTLRAARRFRRVVRPRALRRGECTLALVPVSTKQEERAGGRSRERRAGGAAPAEPSRQPSSRRQPTPRRRRGRRGAAASARRGSRGGRGRRKPGAAADGGDGRDGSRRAGREAEGRRREKRERAQRAERSRAGAARRASAQRRRQPPRRAPLPAAKRELLISVDVGEQRVAVLEDDRVAEVYLERPERRSIAGNIYLGTVDNVLPGMEAAFVEIGLEKNGFLYVDEIVVPELEGKRHGKKIQDLI